MEDEIKLISIFEKAELFDNICNYYKNKTDSVCYHSPQYSEFTELYPKINNYRIRELGGIIDKFIEDNSFKPEL